MLLCLWNFVYLFPARPPPGSWNYMAIHFSLLPVYIDWGSGWEITLHFMTFSDQKVREGTLLFSHIKMNGHIALLSFWMERRMNVEITLLSCWFECLAYDYIRLTKEIPCWVAAHYHSLLPSFFLSHWLQPCRWRNNHPELLLTIHGITHFCTKCLHLLLLSLFFPLENLRAENLRMKYIEW